MIRERRKSFSAAKQRIELYVNQFTQQSINSDETESMHAKEISSNSNAIPRNKRQLPPMNKNITNSADISINRNPKDASKGPSIYSLTSTSNACRKKGLPKKITKRRCTVTLDRLNIPNEQNYILELPKDTKIKECIVKLDRVDLSNFQRDEADKAADQPPHDSSQNILHEEFMSHFVEEHELGLLMHKNSSVISIQKLYCPYIFTADSDPTSEQEVEQVELEEGDMFDARSLDTEEKNSNISNHSSKLPALNQQLQFSHTAVFIPWNPGSGISEDLDAVHCSRRSVDSVSEAGVVEPKKYFIDSSNISYGHLIKYGSVTLSVNCFNHGDRSIEHHFLSKFCRGFIAEINSDFKGYIYASNTTARLLSMYSNIEQGRIKNMHYDHPITIGNIRVTAIEVPSFPGGSLFLFEAKNEKSKIHVGNFRLTSELEENSTLTNSVIDHVQFDKSILSHLMYNFPKSTDRYIDLMYEVYEFIKSSLLNGLNTLVVIGAHEIGMEFLVLRIAENFNSKVYMCRQRRDLLSNMHTTDDTSHDTSVKRLLPRIVTNPADAMLHVLPVEDITLEHILQYISPDEMNFHSFIGIRPRGLGNTLQTVYNGGVHKIVDIANPLIGDINEYERFVQINIEKQLKPPRI